LQSAVYLLFITVSGYGFVLGLIWLYPIAFVAALLFTVAVILWVSSMNVRYRDMQHLIGLALLVWFWLTPIVYSAGTVHSTLSTKSWGALAWRVYLLNPMAWVVMGLQRALYHSEDAAKVLAPFTTQQLAVEL